MNLWIKDTKGEPNSMLTFSTVAFMITSLSVLLSSFEQVSIGSFTVDVKIPSETLLLGYMAMFVTGYVVRRNSKDKLDVVRSEDESPTDGE